ncbi:uncharacterized protein LOC116413220 [Galleria mellonella]|uniref:Uncharacterized protein LOC116413220 n=1 Tax=Galleria mellonella TaxID=7137 RepID=A0A6J3C2Q3_GALME|nr:uncharacterized protein LOC116413220 [Galleria mellonella]
MKIYAIQCIILGLFYIVNCRDFYIGMFKRNDFLVAQDKLYKEKIPFRLTYAKYGRVFKCPITYLRVVDRLGTGLGPKTEIIRGGLRKNYVVLRLTSPYNCPIYVNIYVGCENNSTRAVVTSPTTVALTSHTAAGVGIKTQTAGIGAEGEGTKATAGDPQTNTINPA